MRPPTPTDDDSITTSPSPPSHSLVPDIIKLSPGSPRSAKVIEEEVTFARMAKRGADKRKERYEIPNEVPFPLRVHIMLQQTESFDQTHIVSWMPSGRAFRVHDKDAFSKEVLPDYFRSSNFRSFQRNLSVYQFSRMWTGPEKGAYFHEKFVRHDRKLCTQMRRNLSSAPTSPNEPPRIPQDSDEGGSYSGDYRKQEAKTKTRACVLAPGAGGGKQDDRKQQQQILSDHQRGMTLQPQQEVGSTPTFPTSNADALSQMPSFFAAPVASGRGSTAGAPGGGAAMYFANNNPGISPVFAGGGQYDQKHHFFSSSLEEGRGRTGGGNHHQQTSTMLVEQQQQQQQRWQPQTTTTMWGTDGAMPLLSPGQTQEPYDEDDPFLLDRLWLQTLNAGMPSKNPLVAVRPISFGSGGGGTISPTNSTYNDAFGAMGATATNMLMDGIFQHNNNLVVSGGSGSRTSSANTTTDDSVNNDGGGAAGAGGFCAEDDGTRSYSNKNEENSICHRPWWD